MLGLRIMSYELVQYFFKNQHLKNYTIQQINLLISSDLICCASLAVSGSTAAFALDVAAILIS